jgi:hypothetical protein
LARAAARELPHPSARPPSPVAAAVQASARVACECAAAARWLAQAKAGCALLCWAQTLQPAPVRARQRSRVRLARCRRMRARVRAAAAAALTPTHNPVAAPRLSVTPVRASAAGVGGQMERPHGGADAAAAAAAVATVAPLMQLKRAAAKAHQLGRFARAVELYERALAAAELAQPRDSLIIASLHEELGMAHCRTAQANPSSPATYERMDELFQRSLRLLPARWQAGTLFAPTAEEVAYLVEDEYPCLPAQMCGAYFYIETAKEAARLQRFLPPCTPAEAEVRLHGVYGALRAALEMDARGMLERNPRTGQAWPASSGLSAVMISNVKMAVHSLVTDALSDEAGMLLRMRATCGLSPAEETALRQLAERHKAVAERNVQELSNAAEDLKAERQQAAAADVARHGLRRCALPSCDAQEPHPKLFKLCGRCRSAAYCCPEHSKVDWKRHKRADGCAAAP